MNLNVSSKISHPVLMTDRQTFRTNSPQSAFSLDRTLYRSTRSTKEALSNQDRRKNSGDRNFRIVILMGFKQSLRGKFIFEKLS